jgi:hypothetical protein
MPPGSPAIVGADLVRIEARDFGRSSKALRVEEFRLLPK